MCVTAFRMGCINEIQGDDEQGVAGITPVVGQKEQVQKKKGKRQVFQCGRREITSHCCVISCTTPAALHPERFFNLRKALTPEEEALSLSAPALQKTP